MQRKLCLIHDKDIYDTHLHRKKIDDDDDDEEMKKKKIVVFNFDFISNI